MRIMIVMIVRMVGMRKTDKDDDGDGYGCGDVADDGYMMMMMMMMMTMMMMVVDHDDHVKDGDDSEPGFSLGVVRVEESWKKSPLFYLRNSHRLKSTHRFRRFG